jgi:hypothetical protein
MREKPDRLRDREIRQAEDGWRLSLPASPYRTTSAVLSVPERAIELTLGVFAAYVERRVESGSFWYGDRDGAGGGIVRAVVVPDQTNAWGNYHVSAAAMEAVADATRLRGWRNLAQLHTHPGRVVEHSPYDDVHANSRRALSLVFPSYGERDAIGLSLIGVHEWQNDYWHLLPPAAAATRIAVVGDGEVSLIDTRQPDAARGRPDGDTE